jgi:hypothetical protein
VHAGLKVKGVVAQDLWTLHPRLPTTTTTAAAAAAATTFTTTTFTTTTAAN